VLSDLLVQYNPDGSLVYVNPYTAAQVVGGRQPFSYVELELDFCANTAGIAPCTATVRAAKSVNLGGLVEVWRVVA